MNPREFDVTISRFPDLSEKEVALLEAVLASAPYCQTARILKAKALKNSGSTQGATALQTAAVYCQDRSLLKRWMEASEAKNFKENIKSDTQPASDLVEAKTETQPISAEVMVKQGSAIQEKIELKNPIQIITPTGSSPIVETAAPADQVMKDLGELKKRKDKFRELTQNLAEPETAKEIEKAPKKHNRVLSEVAIGEQVIQEIKTSRKRIKPDSQKQSEQLEIIDKFIKAKLTVIKPASAPIKSDFTEPSGGYSENVISETLVDILERQGKKEKAVEVLKKLIWKFPQKKALFAARIEKLSQ